MLSVAGFFLIRGVISEYYLSKNYCVSIATTGKRLPGGYVEYQFKIKGIIYTNNDKAHRLTPGGSRYFVECNFKDPSDIANIVSNEEVPDCIGEPPTDGWKEIPKCK